MILVRARHYDAVELRAVGDDVQHVINNLYPLFIHDQWAYSDTLPNQHGVIGSARRKNGDEPRSLAEQAEMLAPYWRGAQTHHAFLVDVDGLPAGFALIQSKPAAPERCDFYFDEFFLLHPYRGSDVAEQAVVAVWRQRAGTWCLDVKRRNRPAHSFWRKMLLREHARAVSETSLNGNFGEFTRIRFSI